MRSAAKVGLAESLPTINYSCCRNGSLYCFKLLFAQNIKQISQDKSLLTTPSVHGHVNIIRYILSSHSQFKDKSDFLVKILQNAASNNQSEVVEYLIKNGLVRNLEKSNINDEVGDNDANNHGGAEDANNHGVFEDANNHGGAEDANNHGGAENGNKNGGAEDSSSIDINKALLNIEGEIIIEK